MAQMELVMKAAGFKEVKYLSAAMFRMAAIPVLAFLHMWRAASPRRK